MVFLYAIILLHFFLFGHFYVLSVRTTIVFVLFLFPYYQLFLPHGLQQFSVFVLTETHTHRGHVDCSLHSFWLQMAVLCSLQMNETTNPFYSIFKMFSNVCLFLFLFFCIFWMIKIREKGVNIFKLFFFFLITIDLCCTSINAIFL